MLCDVDRRLPNVTCKVLHNLILACLQGTASETLQHSQLFNDLTPPWKVRGTFFVLLIMRVRLLCCVPQAVTLLCVLCRIVCAEHDHEVARPHINVLAQLNATCLNDAGHADE